MLEGGKISPKQVWWLIITTILSTSILFLPAAMFRKAKQDSWLSVILITLLGLVVGFIITKLGTRFPGQTIIGYSPQIVGQILGKLIGFIYILYFLHINAVIIREFGEFLTTVFYLNTPIVLIIATIVLLSASAVRNGLEVISRVNELVFPAIILFLVLVFILILPDLTCTPLQPVLADGLMPVVKGAYPAALFFGEVIVVAMILPAVNRPKQAFVAVSKALGVIGLFGMVLMLELIALFCVEVAQLQFPLLSLIRYISLFGFLERIDALVMVIWVGGVFIKITVFYYCLSVSTAEFFNLKTYKPVVLPLGVMLVALSIILFSNTMEVSQTLFQILPPYYLFVEVGLPLLLLIIAIIRGIRGEAR